jgi:hypothetical protein
MEAETVALITAIGSTIGLILGAIFKPLFTFLTTLLKAKKKNEPPKLSTAPRNPPMTENTDRTGRNISISQVQQVLDQVTALVTQQPATQGDLLLVKKEVESLGDKLETRLEKMSYDIGGVRRRLEDHIEYHGGTHGATTETSRRTVRSANSTK